MPSTPTRSTRSNLKLETQNSKHHDAVVVSAPGKLFLLGEYAVLEGAPALVAAVNRRAAVRLKPSPDGYWRLTAAQIGVRGLRLEADGRLPAALDAQTAAALNVYAAVRELAVDTLPVLHLEIDTAAFHQAGHKLGLGSSAAVAAALTDAFARAAGETLDRAALCERAMAGHRAAQEGAGSGADIAAAVYGGLVVFTSDNAPGQLSWPQDLHATAIVTGSGADTRALLDRVAAYAHRDPDGYRECMQPLWALAEAGRRALADDDVAAFLQAADAYHAGLALLGEAAAAGIVTAAHRELHAVIADAGGVFKPSGAGGGDLGLAFAADATTHAAVGRAVARLGFEVMPLTFNAAGLTALN